MSNKRWAAGVLLGATLAAAGCGSAPVYAHGVAASLPAASARPYGAADTAFGLDLLGAWCRPNPQSNRLFSPSSLASGLGLAYLGARGSTAKAMGAVLHLPATGGPALEAGLHARSVALHDLDGPGVTVLDSDQVWTDPSLRTLPSYLNSVATAYGTSVAKVPLLNNSPAAARQINAAIATATRGKIPQLFAGHTLGAAPVLGWVLTDVLYLNAAWATPFQASQTKPGTFTTADGQQISVRYLNGGQFRTVRTDGWTAVSLPYRGGRLAMTALLPPAGAKGCALPTPTALTGMTGRLADGAAGAGAGRGVSEGPVELPKVNLSLQPASMAGLLSEIGLGPVFGPSADFTALSPQASDIAMVTHAATLQVGEKGTVGSAATAVGLAPTVVQPPGATVAFDRPYLLLVTGAATREPLFMAWVANPDAS
ncbi:MAG: serpin family protein [Streptosporangiaceae bacterium]